MPEAGSDAPDALVTYLREEMTSHGWDKAALARACGGKTTTSLVSKWLNDDPAKRTAPSVASLGRLARALDLDEVELLRLAGRLPGPQVEPPPDRQLRLAGEWSRRLHAIVSTMPRTECTGVEVIITGLLDGLSLARDRLAHPSQSGASDE